MHWAHVGEVGFLGGIRFLHWLYRHGGIRLFRVCLFFVIFWFFLGQGLARRASLEYLARLHETSGGTTPPPTLLNSFRHFMRFGENLLDKLLAVDIQEKAQASYRVEGAEAFLRLLDEGRGAIIITAHFGNLELCRRLAHDHRAHVRFAFLAHTRHTDRFQRILRAMNLKHEFDLLQVDKFDVTTAMQLSEHVAAGGIVIVAGDRIPVTPQRGKRGGTATPGGASTLTSSFLGKEAHFPVGPYVLGAALGCPVLMMFSARYRDGLSITVRQLAERIELPRRSRESRESREATRETAIQPYLDTYVATLAGECAQNPLQWFNFYPFWQQPPS